MANQFKGILVICILIVTTACSAQRYVLPDNATFSKQRIGKIKRTGNIRVLREKFSVEYKLVLHKDSTYIFTHRTKFGVSKSKGQWRYTSINRIILVGEKDPNMLLPGFDLSATNREIEIINRKKIKIQTKVYEGDERYMVLKAIDNISYTGE